MIQVKQVWKTFGDKAALKGIDFTINRGEIVGLLGHNGAGKTTTLRLLTTLLEPTRGEISILDPEFDSTADRRAYKARLGFLPDEAALFPYLTGREMLYFMGSLYQMDPETVRVKTQYFLDLLEVGTAADDYVKSYSRGTKRKISIIGTLLHDPAYWFLDEPTESLDPVATRVLKDLILDSQRENRAVVISTHQLGLAENLCNRLVILHEGRVVFEGSMAFLRQTTGSDLASLEDIYVRLFCRSEVRGPGSEA